MTKRIKIHTPETWKIANYRSIFLGFKIYYEMPHYHFEKIFKKIKSYNKF